MKLKSDEDGKKTKKTKKLKFLYIERDRIVKNQQQRNNSKETTAKELFVRSKSPEQKKFEFKNVITEKDNNK